MAFITVSDNSCQLAFYIIIIFYVRFTQDSLHHANLQKLIPKRETIRSYFNAIIENLFFLSCTTIMNSFLLHITRINVHMKLDTM